MNNKELQELLKQHPDDYPVMLLDPRENAYCPTGVFQNYVYIYDEEENETKVPALYLTSEDEDDD